MREILFRGKDIKGNWYEGLLRDCVDSCVRNGELDKEIT